MFLTGILSLLAILGNYLQPSCFRRVKAREASEIIVELSRVLVENHSTRLFLEYAMFLELK